MTISRRWSPALAALALQTLLWLFLIQTLRVLFSSLFGVIYDGVFDESLGMYYLLAVAAGLIVAFVVALIGGRLRPRGALAIGTIALLARVAVTFDLPTMRLWAGLLVVGAAFISLTAFRRRGGRRALDALVAALLLDQVLRALGTTWDISLQTWWWPAQIILSLAGLWLVSRAWQDDSWAIGKGVPLPAGIALGALLFLQLNLLGLPNALAHWSGIAYAWMAPALFAISLLGAWLGRERGGNMGFRALLALLMVAGLLAGHYASGALSAAGLLVAAGSGLGLIAALPSASERAKTGAGITLGNVAFLVLSFGLAFAFTYPYTVPALQDSGIIWFVAAALLGFLALWGQAVAKPRWNAGVMIGAILFGTGLILILALPLPITAPSDDDLRLGTYNIHYGYDTVWHLSLARQAETIEAAGMDVIALQEVDTGRITSFSIDNALWLGRRLNMHVLYLPTIEQLTGIALLSKYPIVEAAMIPLPSDEEATGLIHARLQVGQRQIDSFATWLGLSEEERERQISAALEWVAMQSPAGPASFAGDLNSRPDSPTYRRLSAAGFDDPFRMLGLGDVPTSPAVDPRNRIDFVSTRELTPVDAGVPDSVASDHRAVWVENMLPRTED